MSPIVIPGINRFALDGGVARVTALVLCCWLPAMVGCSESSGQADPQIGQCYPAGPHVPRIQHLRSFSGDDFKKATSGGGFWQALFGGSSEPIGGLIKPYGVVADDGKLFVCDVGRGEVFVFDFNLGTYGPWAHPGHKLAQPVSLFVEDDGGLVVADAELGAVISFDATGGLRSHVDLTTMQEASPDAGLPEQFRPVAVAPGPNDTVAVLNAAAHRVELVDLDTGCHLGSWSGPGSATGRLYLPTGMSRDSGGTLWITDRLNRRVLALGPAGEQVGSFGDAGDQPGYLSQPRGVAVESEIVYLVDAGLPGLQLFDRSGGFLTGLGYPGDPGFELALPAGVCLDRSCLPYFQDSIRPGFEAEYLIFVTDQLGPYRVHVYAFGQGPARSTD